MVRKKKTAEKRLEDYFKKQDIDIFNFFREHKNFFVRWYPDTYVNPNELKTIIKMFEYGRTIQDMDDYIVISRIWYSNRPNKGRGVNELKEYYELIFGAEYAKEWFEKKQQDFRGKNNPGFNHQGKMSKWSKNFKEERTEEEYLKDKNELIEKSNNTRAKNPHKMSTRIEFYLDKGMSEEEAKIALRERQSTFSKEKCIERAGNEEEGLRIWNGRQEKWLSTLAAKSDEEIAHINSLKGKQIGGSSSRGELELLSYIRETLGGEVLSQKRLIHSNKRWYFYDVAYKNKIIEYNGDVWHLNPKFFSKDYIQPKTGYTAEDVWAKDAHKIKIANEHGFEVLTVWESEYIKNKQEVIEKCIQFLSN